MSERTLTRTTGPSMARRRFLAATAGTASGLAALKYGPTGSPVQEAEAVPPLLVVLGVGGLKGLVAKLGMATGMALVTERAFDAWEDYMEDSEGLEDYVGEEALQNEVCFRIAQNATTLQVVMNAVMDHAEGSENVALNRAKRAAIEELNDQPEDDVDMQEVFDAGQDEIDQYYGDMEKRFVNAYNEYMLLLKESFEQVKDHSDLTTSTVFREEEISGSGLDGNWSDNLDNNLTQSTRTMLDGTEKDVWWFDDSYGPIPYDPPEINVTWNFYVQTSDGERLDCWNFSSTNERLDIAFEPDGDSGTNPVRFHENQDTPPLDVILDAYDTASSNFDLWHGDALAESEPGDIDVSDVLSPELFAQEYAAEEDEHHVFAYADMLALGYGVGDHNTTTAVETEAGWSLEGLLGLSPENNMEIEVGQTYDPGTMDGPVFMSFNPATAYRDVPETEYDGTLEDGYFFLTEEEPLADTLWQIETGEESTSIPAEDFAEVDGTAGEPMDDPPEDAEWYVSLTNENEEVSSTADVDEVTTYFTEDMTHNMFQLEEEFTVTEYTDGEGETYEEGDTYSITYETTNEQTEDNFITQEDWDAYRERTEGFDEYEETDGGGIGLPGFLDDLTPVQAAVTGAAGIGGGWLAINALRPGP